MGFLAQKVEHQHIKLKDIGSSLAEVHSVSYPQKYTLFRHTCSSNQCPPFLWVSVGREQEGKGDPEGSWCWCGTWGAPWGPAAFPPSEWSSVWHLSWKPHPAVQECTWLEADNKGTVKSWQSWNLCRNCWTRKKALRGSVEKVARETSVNLQDLK